MSKSLNPMSTFPHGADPTKVEVYEQAYSQKDGHPCGVAVAIGRWPEQSDKAVGWRWKTQEEINKEWKAFAVPPEPRLT